MVEALKVVGGPAKLARLLRIQPSAITQWSRFPAERVPEISRLTGIPRHQLRPDLWEPPEEIAGSYPAVTSGLAGSPAAPESAA